LHGEQDTGWRFNHDDAELKLVRLAGRFVTALVHGRILSHKVAATTVMSSSREESRAGARWAMLMRQAQVDPGVIIAAVDPERQRLPTVRESQEREGIDAGTGAGPLAGRETFDSSVGSRGDRSRQRARSIVMRATSGGA
jgi:hypothetical protein